MKGFVNQQKRIFAGLMAFVMVLSTILSYDIVAFAASTASTIVAWEQTSLENYDEVPYAATTGNGSLTLVGATPTAFDQKSGFNANGWNEEEAYWLMSFSTEAYSNISFSAKMMASATGPKNVQLQYSIDEGNTWTALGEEVTLTSSTKQVFENVSLPEEASGLSNVLVRILRTSDTAVNGGTVQENGTCAIKDIVITSEDQTAVVHTEKASSSSFEVETGVELEIARWAGTGNSGENTVIYADLEQDNDYADTASSISVSTGVIPLITNTASTGGTTYCLGAKGLTSGEYYLIETTSEKYGNVSLTFNTKGSKTSTKTLDVSYSTDNENFTFVETLTISEASKYSTFTTQLPEGASNAEKLYIRLTAGSANFNGTEVSATSNNYIQNISITANPIITDDVTSIVNVTPDAGEIPANQELTMSSKTEGATIYYSINGGEEAVYDPENKPVIKELPAYVTTRAVKEGKEDSLEVTYAYTQAQVATVKSSPNGGAVVKGTKITLTCATEGATILYSLDEGATWLTYDEDEKVTLSELPATLYAKAEKEGYIDSTRISLSFTERVNEEYNLYFGQLHSHTNLSDGTGDIEDAFEYASNAHQIDFLAVTDHSNSFDGIDTASLASAEDSTKWALGHTAADNATTDDFVAIYGFEMTWSNGLGHMNTFNTEGFQSRTQSAFTSYATALQNYYTTLKTDTSSISQFNHPGTSFGDFSDFAHYDEETDNLINLIEVGNGEGAIGSTGYFPSYEYYTRALDKGWHVAPTISQDNHKGKWGDANTGRTVVLADVLDRENIYDALRNKRVYASEDDDLEIRYTLDGNVMGSELSVDEVGDTVTLEVEVKDETDDAIGTVQVIVNGGLVVASEEVTTNEGKVTFTLPSTYSYYYIKVVQADGAIAVTSPVWVGDVEAVGISSVSTSTALPVQGEAVDITLDMYNNESSDLLINSIQFSIGGEVVHTVDLEEANMTKVPSMGTSSYTFDLTQTKVGSVSVDVVVNATLDGVEKVYNGLLKLEYVSPNMVTNIIVDGTHFNDYVTGYYGGNMTNFAQLASTNNAKVTIVTDEITDEILADCDLLVVSAPARKTATSNTGSYTVSEFEDEFLERVKNYTDNGGSIVVCGIADYQDTEACQSSVQINKLLEAIGSTVKVNSDQMQDNTNNGGQSYRLYFTEFNQDSFIMEGTVEGQEYSAYSGCSVDITNATEDTETAKAAEWLVKGHETTYSLNTKDENGAYLSSSEYTTVVEEGEVIAAASQELASGGLVVVAGTVFMSNFEVEAELDNIWDVPYANRTMMENLISKVKAELPLSTIAEARQGELGDVFRVQGRVTAGTAVESNKFFDTIYIQDSTGGITIFPYSVEGLEVGTLVEVTGYVDSYQGDLELQITDSKIISEELEIVEPTQMSAKDAMDYDNNGGQLIQVEGKVVEVEVSNGVVGQFRVEDENGDVATVFIDGYITSGSGEPYDLTSFVKEGNIVSAVGLLYKHPEGSSDVSVPVLRVRNTEEIKLVKEATTDEDTTTDEETTPTPTPSAPSTDTTDTTVSVGKVSGLKVTKTTTTSVALSWTKVSGATGYRVGTYVNGKWTYTTVKTNSLTLKKLKSTTVHSFKVQAYKTVNGKTYYGTASTIVKTATNPTKTKVSTVSGKTAIKVSYKAVSGVSGYEVAQYKNGKWVTVKTANSKTTTVTVKGLKTGTTYKFKVRSYITVNGKKIYSNYSSVVTTATKTKAPSITSIKTSNKKVTLTWKKVSGADGYVVYKYNASKKKYVKVKTINKASTVKYTESGLKKGTTVKYKVVAYNKVGSKTVYSDYSAVKSIKVK